MAIEYGAMTKYLVVDEPYGLPDWILCNSSINSCEL